MAQDAELKWNTVPITFDLHESSAKVPKERDHESTRRPHDDNWKSYFDEAKAENHKANNSMSKKSSLALSVSETDYVPTPPIDVPVQRAEGYEDGATSNSLSQDSRYCETVEDYLAKRRPSITFNPEVMLENGNKMALEHSLPKLKLKIRPRGKSLLQELSKQSAKSPLGEVYNRSEPVESESQTDQRLSVNGEHEIRYTQHQLRYPLLQSTVDELAADSPPIDLAQSLSLTTESTALPVQKEVHAPFGDPSAPFMSPSSFVPPWQHPTSLEESSAWPSLRQLSLSSRPKSYTFERVPSIRQARRRFSRRSATNSLSPASAFLSKWVREEKVPEPDSEGQQVGDYVLGKEIGFGGFSTIREAYSLSNTSRVAHAVKIVRKLVAGKEETENDALQAEFEHEVALWRCLSHKHILPLLAVYITDFATFAFTRLTTGGTLFDLVRSNRQGLSASLVRRYSFHLASAVRYLHEDVRIVHRDLKLENCLLDLSAPESAETGGTLLLCDFGLAGYMTHDRNGDDSDSESEPGHAMGPSATSTSITGSLPYASPEVVRGHRSVLRPAVDIWAYGVVIFALVVGGLPFPHNLAPKVSAMILEGRWDRQILKRKAEDWKGVNDGGNDGGNGADDRRGDEKDEDEPVVELLSNCLEMDAVKRWTIGMCLRSRWLKDCEEENGEDDMGTEQNGWGNGN